jgi:membrane-bound serine protease (ClpP class)
MLVVCAVLLIVGLALVFFEMFVPSAGVLGFISAACIVLSVTLAYVYHGLVIGTVFLVVASILTPISLAVAIRWYPETSLGRLVMPLPPTPEEVLPIDEVTGQLRRLKGQVGKAVTPLLPGGTVKVEGKIYSAVSEGEPIDLDDLVLVVRVDSTRIVVRRVEESQWNAATTVCAPVSTPHVNDVLSQPIEALGLESLDDPLA